MHKFDDEEIKLLSVIVENPSEKRRKTEKVSAFLFRFTTSLKFLRNFNSKAY